MKGIIKRGKQRGMTLIGFVIGLIVFCFFAYMGMVLGPAYNEFFAVKHAMDFVAGQFEKSSPDINAMQRMLDKQFNVGYVESLSGKQVTLVRDKGGAQLSAVYEVRKKFVYNIDFVLSFDYKTPLGKAGGD
jgi:DNA-dependent RNA polymerase auxiliary subunit epsilon